MSDYKKNVEETTGMDDEILKQLEKKFKGLKCGGSTGAVPHVPKATEVGQEIKTKALTPNSSGIVIAETRIQPDRESNQEPVPPMILNGPLTLGDICLFSNGEIGIYQQGAQGVPYGVFMMLSNDGKVEIRGILLDAEIPAPIGRIPQTAMSAMLVTQTWDHDIIIYSLKSSEFIAYLKVLENKAPAAVAPAQPAQEQEVVLPPASHTRKSPHHNHMPAGKPRAPKPIGARDEHLLKQTDEPVYATPRAPKPLTPENGHQSEQKKNYDGIDESGPLVKGRRIIISHSKISAWKAVYMGDDEKGNILAFKTMNGWELTRLNLTEYAQYLHYGDIISSAKIAEIEDDIINNS